MIEIISVYNNYFKDFKINLDKTVRCVIPGHRVKHHYSKVGIADFGTENFRKLTIEKIGFIQTRLSMNERLLFLDNDIYLLKDPISYLEEYIGDADIVFQDDVNEFVHRGQTFPIVNTGVIYAKKTGQTIDLFDPNSEHIRLMTERENDQHVLNRRLLDLGIDFKVLPKDLFPCGKVWYNDAAHESPYLVHYNWVAGKKNKIRKMKAYGHWKVSKIQTVSAYLIAKVQTKLGLIWANG
jgi:hypothetical protein